MYMRNRDNIHFKRAMEILKFDALKLYYKPQDFAYLFKMDDGSEQWVY